MKTDEKKIGTKICPDSHAHIATVFILKYMQKLMCSQTLIHARTHTHTNTNTYKCTRIYRT